MDHALSNIFLFSDFDGTLVPIRKDPAKVMLSLRARNILTRLSHKIPVAIISGRSLDFLQKTIALPEIILAGNHGLEVKMGADQYRHPDAVTSQKTIKRFVHQLKKALGKTDGILIEEKGLTATFHYRLVAPSQHKAVCKIFYDQFKTCPHRELIKVRAGKMALEVLPYIDWGKKEAILWILERYKKRFPERPMIPMYIGDDETDRAALALIQKIGISIFVGEAATPAMRSTFVLPSQANCIELLRQVALEIG